MGAVAMVAQRTNRMAALCEPEIPEVEVVNTHVSRRGIVPGVWPRSDLRLLPTLRRISVRTAAGVAMKCAVRLWVDGAFVVASARPNDQLEGEDLNASGVFSLDNELEAERVALESI